MTVVEGIWGQKKLYCLICLVFFHWAWDSLMAPISSPKCFEIERHGDRGLNPASSYCEPSALPLSYPAIPQVSIIPSNPNQVDRWPPTEFLSRNPLWISTKRSIITGGFSRLRCSWLDDTVYCSDSAWTDLKTEETSNMTKHLKAEIHLQRFVTSLMGEHTLSSIATHLLRLYPEFHL